MKTIVIKRVYDCKKSDGTYRILIDRLWPRGIKKADLQIDEWNKEIAPSPELRKWFEHKEAYFEEFTKQYIQELNIKKRGSTAIKKYSAKNIFVIIIRSKASEN